MSSSLSQLNILCTSYSPCTRCGQFTCSSSYWISSIYQNIQYFIGSVSNFIEGVHLSVCLCVCVSVCPHKPFVHDSDRILCTRAVKRQYAKNDNSPFTCQPFSRAFKFHMTYNGSKKNLPPSRSARCVRFVGADKSDAIEEVPDRLLK